MKRGLSVTFGVLIVVCAVIGGVVVAKGSAELRGIDASIEEQKANQERVFNDKAKLRHDMEKEKAALSEIPDSLKATRTGKVMKTSQVFAKTEARLDEENLRIKRILRELDRERTRAADGLRNRILLFTGIELVLIVGLVAVRRLPA
jgi:hypothetical protein